MYYKVYLDGGDCNGAERYYNEKKHSNQTGKNVRDKMPKEIRTML